MRNIRIPLLTVPVLLIVSFFLLYAGSVKGQATNQGSFDYQKEFIRLYGAVQRQFFDSSSGFYKDVDEGAPKKPYSYLWPLCGLLQANNEAERAGIPGYPLQKITGLVDYYKSNKAPAPGYDSYIVRFGGGDRFYDDNQWLGLAWMDAWFRKKEPELLDRGKMIYRYMMTGYDTVTGGGLYWEEGKRFTKNTCSNGPGILLALQLYKATQEKKYLDTALLLYNWTNKHLRDPCDGLYFDNIHIDSIHNDKLGTRRVKYAYNSGTMLQASVYLYELTQDPVYLHRAVSLADSSVPYFCGKGRFRDGYWFNAVLLRAYQDLFRWNRNLKYLEAFRKCVDGGLRNDLNRTGVMGFRKPQTLVNQAGMLEILARFVWQDQENSR
ncbi:glycoside hydrolase family 76 protein [Flavitalea flava]